MWQELQEGSDRQEDDSLPDSGSFHTFRHDGKMKKESANLKIENIWGTVSNLPVWKQ
jgi:hypothetical protein